MSGRLRRTSSTESTASVASTSSQRFSGASGRAESGYEYSTTATVTTSYGRNVSDVCALLIHCPRHKRFALAPVGHNRGLWLPYVTMKQSEGWYASAVNKLRSLFNLKTGVKSSRVFTAPEIMHIMRIQLPEVLKYVCRVVFMVNLVTSEPCGQPSLANSSAYRSSLALEPQHSSSHAHGKGSKSGSNSARSSPAQQHQLQHPQVKLFNCFCESKEHVNNLIWLSHETIVNEEETFEIWGPEPAIFSSAFATNSVERGAHSEYTLREAVKYQARESPRNHQEELLTSCHLERSDVLRLYSDYVQHCYPSQNMNLISFRDYLARLGYEDTRQPQSVGSAVSSSVAQQEHQAQHDAQQSGRSSASNASGGATASIATSSSNVASRAQPAQSGHGALNGHDMHSLYRAFKSKRMPYVTFHELLLGLAAMDRNTVHGGRTGEMRCAYIFRYYDADANGQLDVEELRAMAHDRLRMHQLKNVAHSVRANAAAADQQQQQQQQNSTGNNSNNNANNSSNSKSHSKSRSSSKNIAAAALAAASSIRVDAESVKQELASILKMLKMAPSDTINEPKFMLAVGSMQLRGTSLLFRSQVSVIPVKQHYDVMKERQALTDIEGNLVGGELHRMGTCPRCKEKHYKLALHTIKLTQDCQVVEPTEVRFDEYPPPISRIDRQLSRATFSSDTTPNKLVDMITTYWNAVAASLHHAAGGSGTGVGGGGVAGGGGAGAGAANSSGHAGSISPRMAYGLTNAVPLGKTTWERIDRQTLAEYIRRICQQAEAVFKQEPRVVPVTSPCYVMGDIHGNLADLRIYERLLWPGAPCALQGSYLFLGDYVDRGDYGLECIVYLICMKILAPKTFYLLRGNHELRSIQQAFTFYREVCEKFRNQALGVQVWETLNKAFDYMPIAATIDDQIYCAHGGIPTSAIRLDELYNIPSPLQDPENQSPCAWEMLWNDPVSSTEYAEYADLLRKQPGGQQAVANMQGYLPNTKRGTAFFFSEEAVKRFLHINNLSYVIRAHECVPPGYALHCNAKVITIFSSSHYCGATNDAACILVEREKIRIIRIDTD